MTITQGFVNGVQSVSLNGNGISGRDGNPMRTEKIVRNGALDEKNGHLVGEGHLQNGSIISPLRGSVRTTPRADEYDVDFS
jgi:hypothetical protein